MSKEPEILEAMTRDILPEVLPAGWHYNRAVSDDVLDNVREGLRVILNVMRYSDGRAWAHMSVSRRDQRLPTWDQLRELKELFLGKQRKAIQVLPPADQYVNVNPGVLHLFCCLADEDPIPDFRVNGQL